MGGKGADRREDAKRRILEALRNAPSGVMQAELAERAGVSYPTVLKYLQIFRTGGLADYRLVGRARLWFSDARMRALKRRIDASVVGDIVGVGPREVRLLGLRFLLVGRDVMAELVGAVYEGLGYQRASSLLYGVGFRLGRGYADLWGPRLRKTGGEELLKFQLVFGSILGWGRMKLVRFDAARGECVIKTHGDPIAERLRHIGRPVNHLEAGAMAGMLGSVFGREVRVVEEKCVAKGDRFCEFRAVGQPLPRVPVPAVGGNSRLP